MNHSFNALLNVQSIKSSSFSLIRLCGNVVYRVEKIVCRQARRTEPFTFQFTEHLARIVIDQNQFLFEVFIHRLTVSYDMRFDGSKTGS